MADALQFEPDLTRGLTWNAITRRLNGHGDRWVTLIPSELADEVHLQRSWIVRRIAQLARYGYLVKSPARHRDRAIVRLTEKGCEAAKLHGMFQPEHLTALPGVRVADAISVRDALPARPFDDRLEAVADFHSALGVLIARAREPKCDHDAYDLELAELGRSLVAKLGLEGAKSLVK